MGYALQYDLQNIKVTKNKKNREYIHHIIMSFILVLCTLAMYLGGTAFQTFILGDREAVKTAAEQMVKNIQEGSSLNDAVEVFYAELAE